MVCYVWLPCVTPMHQTFSITSNTHCCSTNQPDSCQMACHACLICLCSSHSAFQQDVLFCMKQKLNTHTDVCHCQTCLVCTEELCSNLCILFAQQASTNRMVVGTIQHSVLQQGKCFSRWLMIWLRSIQALPLLYGTEHCCISWLLKPLHSKVSAWVNGLEAVSSNSKLNRCQNSCLCRTGFAALRGPCYVHSLYCSAPDAASELVVCHRQYNTISYAGISRVYQGYIKGILRIG